MAVGDRLSIGPPDPLQPAAGEGGEQHRHSAGFQSNSNQHCTLDREFALLTESGTQLPRPELCLSGLSLEVTGARGHVKSGEEKKMPQCGHFLSVQLPHHLASVPLDSTAWI